MKGRCDIVQGVTDGRLSQAHESKLSGGSCSVSLLSRCCLTGGCSNGREMVHRAACSQLYREIHPCLVNKESLTNTKGTVIKVFMH